MRLVGRLILNTIAEASKIYLSAVVASGMIRTADQQWEDLKKEVVMQGMNSESVNLVHLGPELVSYEPKGIHTEALQVTLENIGKLSLEFEVEVEYAPNGFPFLHVKVSRDDEGIDDPRYVYFRLTDWIVPLRGEIHVFRDHMFRSTFTFDNPTVAAKHAQGPPQIPPMLGNVRWDADGESGIATDLGVYPIRDVDDVNLMDAARSSSKPELRALAEKLSKPLPGPGPLPRSVRHKSTGAYGVIESFGDNGKVWVRMAGSEEILEHDEWELEDIS